MWNIHKFKRKRNKIEKNTPLGVFFIQLLSFHLFKFFLSDCSVKSKFVEFFKAVKHIVVIFFWLDFCFSYFPPFFFKYFIKMTKGQIFRHCSLRGIGERRKKSNSRFFLCRHLSKEVDPHRGLIDIHIRQ